MEQHATLEREKQKHKQQPQPQPQPQQQVSKLVGDLLEQQVTVELNPKASALISWQSRLSRWLLRLAYRLLTAATSIWTGNQSGRPISNRSAVGSLSAIGHPPAQLASTTKPATQPAERVPSPGQMQPPNQRTNQQQQQPDSPAAATIPVLGQHLSRLIIEQAMDTLVAGQQTTKNMLASFEEKSKWQQITSTKDSSTTNRKESTQLDPESVARQIDSMFLDSLAGTNVSPSSTLDDSSGLESGHHSLLAEELALLYESSPGSSLDRDFCGAQSASESTLNRIKQDTCRDVAVCERQRKSVDLARRLFSSLERRDSGLSNRCQLEDGDADAGSDADQHREQPQADEQNTTQEPPYDIKIVRRTGSSASSCNFGQTLVCSVSPLRDQRSASTLGSSTTNSSECLNHQHPLYPIDGPEIQHCRNAFRENKRLIEEVQEQVRSLTLSQNRPNSCPLGPTTNTTSTTNTDWLDKFKRQHARSCEQVCTYCRQRLYLLDKIELDFTKLTLEIHKNCFRCQVCSTMLRLETYASINGKLYCPSHAKQASTPVSR